MRRPKKKAAKKAAKKKSGKKAVKRINKKTAKKTVRKTARKGAKKKAIKKKAVKKTARRPAAKPKAKKAKKPARRSAAKKAAKKPAKKPVGQKKAARRTGPAQPRPTQPSPKIAAPRPAPAPSPAPAPRPTPAPRPKTVPVAPAPAAVAPPSAASVAAKVDRLDLDSWARDAATLIATEFPEITFTSGRRDPAGQARAMAHNIVTAPAGRNWIRVTYRDSAESREMQQWVDDHRDATAEADIAAGLLGVMSAWPPSRLGNMSRHLIGLAFDIQPFSGGNAERVKDRMGSLPHLHGTPLFREGGVERWHVAFKSREEEPE